jgi:hypothetical protein
MSKPRHLISYKQKGPNAIPVTTEIVTDGEVA